MIVESGFAGCRIINLAFNQPILPEIKRLDGAKVGDDQ
ncbi:Uncharacterised protein [Escherichia coli]|nr:Uncharacterised protein [Escherichia coli]